MRVVLCVIFEVTSYKSVSRMIDMKESWGQNIGFVTL